RTRLADGAILRTGAGPASGADVTPGTRPPAQPVHIGPGFIQAGFRAARHGLREHARRGGLQHVDERILRAGRLESQGPPVLARAEYLGEFYRAPGLLVQSRGLARDR